VFFIHVAGQRRGENHGHALSVLELLVTRRAPDGVVYNPEERVDRMTALLLATRWGADYVLNPDVLGSIEVGKWADLVVLDRDCSTVPEDEISGCSRS